MYLAGAANCWKSFPKSLIPGAFNLFLNFPANIFPQNENLQTRKVKF